ncbi:MAG: tetratricopeptide repeat protein [Proteobacteria bacterium]|nr:tetratricopeptide repeat protein [Pseudomonadota bacterium]
MLESFVKRQKNKRLQKAKELVQKGLSQLVQKAYKQATISLTLALEELEEEVAPLLEDEFDRLLVTGKLEAIRAVGLVLLKTRPKDADLLNMMGNYARKLREVKEANHFYRQALKVNKSHQFAFSNLAASLANVDLFDEQIEKVMAMFQENNSYYLPEFKNGVVLSGEEDYEETCEKLRKAIKENWRNRSIMEGKIVLQNDIFNLGLYALTNGDAELAYENFEKLLKQKSTISELNMLLALTKTLHHSSLQESINMLVEQVKDDPQNRLINGNLGLLFRRAGNKLLAMKHFLICYDQLKQYDGFFTHGALVRAANRKYKERHFKKALQLFKIATKDSEDFDLWEKLANLQYQLKDINGALQSYKKVVSFAPDSAEARHKLNLIYNSYVKKAEELEAANKPQQAAVIYERALQIERSPKILKSTAAIYKSLRQFDKAEDLLHESHLIKTKEKNQELEVRRQSLINKGKEHTKRQEFTAAIEQLENAARIKLDKDVFMYLAHIYKGLKRKRALQDLINRWDQITQSEAVKLSNVEAD